jgi:hypothetical protein
MQAPSSGSRALGTDDGCYRPEAEIVREIGEPGKRERLGIRARRAFSQASLTTAKRRRQYDMRLLTERVWVRVLFAEPDVTASSSLCFWLTAVSCVSCDIGQNERVCALSGEWSNRKKGPQRDRDERVSHVLLIGMHFV